jgi:rhodanese-related sulfurtransferase
MRQFRSVLIEAALIVVAGVLLALVANALSPRGLHLSRNYFPGPAGGSAGDAAAVPAPATPVTNAAATPAGTAPSPVLEATLRRLQQHGLNPILSNDVVALFRDFRYEQGLVMFVDARDDADYAAGHIPRAWQFHHYRRDQFLPTLLPACLNAQQVIVYCTGGTCEDSEFAALTLREAGVPAASLFVYPGGVAEWKSLGLPLETGARGSGQIRPPATTP